MPEQVGNEVLLTRQGLQKLEDELFELKTVRRKEVAERIKVARDFGDISENSEYDEAKNEQGFMEKRILQIEQLLRNARIVTEDEVEPELVHVGSGVRVRKADNGEEYDFVIVGFAEGEPSLGRISYQSPVGRALFGSRAGDIVTVITPSGLEIVYEILEVSPPKSG